MTLIYGGPPRTKRQDRESIDGFLYWKFPDLKTLEDLRDLQADEREHLESIERSGGTGRVVEILRSRVNSREIEIKTLKANGLFP
jgi:hypothetical protein